MVQVSDGLRSSFMTLAGVGMMFYMSPQLAFVGLGKCSKIFQKIEFFIFLFLGLQKPA